MDIEDQLETVLEAPDITLRPLASLPEQQAQSSLIDRRAPQIPSQATSRSPSIRPSGRPLTDTRGSPIVKRNRSASRCTLRSPTPFPVSTPSSDSGFNIGEVLLSEYPGYDDWPAPILDGSRARRSTREERTTSSFLVLCPPTLDEWLWYELSALSPLPPERAKALLARGANPLTDEVIRGLWEEGMEIAN